MQYDLITLMTKQDNKRTVTIVGGKCNTLCNPLNRQCYALGMENAGKLYLLKAEA